MSRSDGALGALLGTFVGDALGMPFEGAATAEIPDPVEMVAARRGRGTYTDDTQMMIALAESLVEHGQVEPKHLARAFRAAYEPERGYGRGTRQVMEMWDAGIPIEEAAERAFDGEGSRGNGASMRIAPVAVRYSDDPVRLREEAARSARLTHAHPVGIDAAVVQAAAVGAALSDRDVLEAAREASETAELRERLRAVADLLDAGQASGAPQARLGNSSDAVESVPTAIYASLAHRSFEGAVGFAVGLGGDTDTIAAMAGAIAGARHGASSIPVRWLDALEEGERGRTHVERLAIALLA
jgi:poly(ADP-ribose) glycohydrolase ARH3